MTTFRSLCLALTVPALAIAQPSSTRPDWAASIDSLVQREMARTGTPGAQLAVVVDGQLAYAGVYGVADAETRRPVTTRTLFRVGSVTKMFTAATLSQLAAEGTVDLMAPIQAYVPELTGKRVGMVSTHQLLTHSAGWLDNAVAYGRMGEGALGEVFRVVTDTLLFTEPGRVLSYSNPAFSMAGYVAEVAGKARYAALVDRLVLKKANMPHATFRPLEAMTRDFSQGHLASGNGAPTVVRPYTENTAQWAAGFLMASAAEVAQFTRMLMDGGMLDGARVLDTAAVRRMTTGYQVMPADPTSKYGYGLVIGTRGRERVWQHGGAITGFDAQVVMFPDRRLSVVLVDNRGGAPMNGVIDAVASRVAGIAPPPAPPSAPAREATAVERQQLAGTYAMGAVSVALAERDGALVFVQGTTALPARLVGSEKLQVTAPGGQVRVFTIVRDAAGQPVYLHQGLRSFARK
ncbi:MAG: beta-lactamase family protein [Gemmatimonadaceae bacterium]|nr:beta-lactamase family protein [Gemmatimonadaceae bacterium]